MCVCVYVCMCVCGDDVMATVRICQPVSFAERKSGMDTTWMHSQCICEGDDGDGDDDCEWCYICMNYSTLVLCDGYDDVTNSCVKWERTS
mmetsp:Transcript_30858/g.34558  ORF Transcript_30858/g.34558 Transcript_30858/m.34558 type:complete len:90 (+) Transcript_30858:3-272(+)